jgi:flagellar hook protein FlgE
MGLQSALTTSLTGLQAAEAVIDVVGNNVANSGTVGFKESDVLFANQFLQTQSIGSAPTPGTGGTNPRQIGLGVKVAAINPDFTQGTIQISSNPLDVAIQGDGFLIVQGSQGEQLYTRNGQLQTNSTNDIVTATGNRLLGFAVDENFQIDTTSGLVPLNIPLGNLPVAQATQEAIFAGVLSPELTIGTTPGIVTSQPLGDISVEFPEFDASGSDPFNASDISIVSAPNTNSSNSVHGGVGTLAAGNYQYRVTWFTTDAAAPGPTESAPSGAITVNGVLLNEEVDLSSLPIDTAPGSPWDGRRIYRSFNGGPYTQLGPDLDLTTTTFNDDGSLVSGATLNTSALDQQEYSYYVTFRSSTSGVESRPTALVGPYPISDASSRIRLDNIPQPTGGGFDQIRIYRNIGSNTTEFHLVDTIAPSPTLRSYIDTKSDADIVGNPEIDLLGAKAASTTPLVDVVIRTGDEYSQPFVVGTLSFAGTKGGRTLAAKELEITATTTVNDLRNFMQQSFGVDTTLPGGLAGGSSLNADGELVFTSNRGIENELGVNLSSFRMTPAGGDTTPITLDFEATQEANGEGSTTNFVVFDTLGEPISVRLTTVMEEQTGTSTTFRWFATSEDNEPTSGVNTFLDSGTLVFDRSGNLTSPSDGRATIAIDHPAVNPLVFDLDFSQVSGLAQTDSGGDPVGFLNMTRQDGFPPGVLTSFTITESGLIRGVFSNGAERPLGQIRMVRFANATGLQQVGNNMFSQGINSGEPIEGDPGQGGVGTLTSGAVELSNSDIGQNLIDLILASTQYRGGARVITTTQQLLEELLNLRR